MQGLTKKYSPNTIGSITIPKEWQIYKLGDKGLIHGIRAGGTPLRIKKEYWDNGDIPFVKIQDITQSNKYLYETEEKITKAGLDYSSAWIVPPNSILLSLYASFGEVIINKIPVATNQAIIAIQPKESILNV